MLSLASSAEKKRKMTDAGISQDVYENKGRVEFHIDVSGDLHEKKPLNRELHDVHDNKET